MKVYVYKSDIRSWQEFPAIPEERRSEFYEMTTELAHDELIKNYEFIMKDGECSLVKKDNPILNKKTAQGKLNRVDISQLTPQDEES